MKTIKIAILFFTVILSSSIASEKIILMPDSDPNPQFTKKIIDKYPSAKKASFTDISSVLSDVKSVNNILIMPYADEFPVEAKESLISFLNSGNHLIALSGMPFSEMKYFYNNSFINKDQAKEEIKKEQGVSIIDFANDSVENWFRHSDRMDLPFKHYIADSNHSDFSKALYIEIEKLENIDFISYKDIPRFYPEGYNTITFWAKGGPNTKQIVVDFGEQGKARWMSYINLTEQWQKYVITIPDIFILRQSPHQTQTQFNPEESTKIGFGLAFGVTAQEQGVSHSYAIGDVRAVKHNLADINFNSPVIESISPSYKLYQTSADRSQHNTSGKVIYKPISYYSPIPRPQGFTSEKQHKCRMIPIIFSSNLDTGSKGTLAHIFINNLPNAKPYFIGYCGLSKDSINENQDLVLSILNEFDEKISRGVFILNAGTDKFSYSKDDEISLNSFIIKNNPNFDVKTRFEIISDNFSKEFVIDNITQTGNASNIFSSQSQKIKIDKDGEYKCKVELIHNNIVIDSLEYPFRVLTEKKANQENLVGVKDGQFILNDKFFYPYGMNYFPRWILGAETDPDAGTWLSAEQYNPYIIDEELELAKKMNFNSLSIMYTRKQDAPQLIDFLARAEKHNIKINIFVEHLNPLRLRLDRAKELIDSARLYDFDSFFAYDVAWEPNIGLYERRKMHDPKWHQWVVDRYGSIENAVKDWNYQPEYNGDFITAPSDDQVRNDGEHRVYVAAYRRFLDDEISRDYGIVRRFIREFDSIRPISARSGYGGNGVLSMAPFFPFDLASGAKHFDFISPEAYGITGCCYEDYLVGGFHTAYSRFVSKGKPVFWAEFGVSVYPSLGDVTLYQAAEYYKYMLNMMIDTDAQGLSGWWMPGGLRVQENSDFGILNPDITLRPAAMVLKDMADDFTKERITPEPDYFIKIDRDLYTTGYAGVFQTYKSDYVKAVLDSKNPAFYTDGTNTDTSNTPMLAVGNVPINGSNPPKYINSEFNYVKINNQVVRRGDELTIKKDEPIKIEVSVGNTSEAKWLSLPENQKGSVGLKLVMNGSESLISITEDVPMFSDTIINTEIMPNQTEGTISLKLNMEVLNITPFGEIFDCKLKVE
ncbi:MAG: hypothetical protein SNJ70_02730 [Armatimonadota bacterium]